MNEDEVVQDIAATFMSFCMPREKYADALIFAQEVYDTKMRPILRDTYNEGRNAPPDAENPYEG